MCLFLKLIISLSFHLLFGIMNFTMLSFSFRVSTSCALVWGPNPSKILRFLKWLLPSICDYIDATPLLFCLSVLLLPIITKFYPSLAFGLFKNKNKTKNSHVPRTGFLICRKGTLFFLSFSKQIGLVGFCGIFFSASE